MSDASYIIAAWAVVTLVLAAYVAFTLYRGRALSKRVPADQRRWS